MRALALRPLARIAIWLTLFTTVVSSADAAIAIVVGPAAVTVRGVTAGGEVVLFGRSHEYVGSTPRLSRVAQVRRDEDGDGSVSFPVAALPRHTTLVAVDYDSGAWATGAPAGHTPAVLVLPAGAWRDGAATIDLSRGYLDFLFVRPRKGAWTLDVFQGSARDDDGVANATLRARLASMRPLVGKEAAPPQATKKDVLVIIDPRELDVVVVAAE